MTHDFEERQQALNIQHSCIIQAPAGSGKTELLTQRFLNLLANSVKDPEEIIAITFTQKAAQEMRHRILSSLKRAATTSSIPDQEPEQSNWKLAKQVLCRSEAYQWHLMDNPQRLNIYTFDGLALRIVEQLPLLSKLGSDKRISDRPASLYEEATQNLFENLNKSSELQDALLALLEHLDNDLNRLEKFIIALLGRRDQWVHHIVPYRQAPQAWKEVLTQSWQAIENYYVEQLAAQFLNQPALFNRLCQCGRFALLHLPDTFFESKEIRAHVCEMLDNATTPRTLSCDTWKTLALLVTRKDGSKRVWRSSSAQGVTARIGFPAAKKDQTRSEQEEYKDAKQQMIGLLKELEDIPQLKEEFSNVLKIPNSTFETHPWALMEALLCVLPYALAELELVMRDQGQCDFTAIALGAIQALGDAETPSDILLKLDYQIKHLLVDEFQDTSITQYQFIERLVSNWSDLEQRTLFLVGDPMQSIYRFREADVSLFYKARKEGLGPVTLKDIRLKLNFRSEPALVNWFNQSFNSIFPKTPDALTGSVCYELASTLEPPGSPDSLSDTSFAAPVTFAVCENPKTQMEEVAAKVAKIHSAQPTASIAILVRSRSHTPLLFQTLRKEAIPYQTTDMERLSNLLEISDLFHLANALYYWDDALSWTCLLHSPLCGLSMAEIQQLETSLRNNNLRNNKGSINWPTLVHITSAHIDEEQLSDTIKSRLIPFCLVIQDQLQFLGAVSARRLIHTSWQRLGGPATVNPSNQTFVDTFFVLVEQAEIGGILDINLLEEKVTTEFANQAPSDDNTSSKETTSTIEASATTQVAQVMTIHKSKGLEFDHVLIPHIEASGRPDDPSLVAWQYSVLPNEQPILLMAPNKGVGKRQESKYDFLKQLNQDQAQQELIRLFYVGATRAKSRLHLYCVHKNRIPIRDNFLSLLSTQTHYVQARETFEQHQPELPADINDTTANTESLNPILRPTLTSYDRWHTTLGERHLTSKKQQIKQPTNPVIDLNTLQKGQEEGQVAKAVGIFIHDWLDTLVRLEKSWPTAFQFNDHQVAHIESTFRQANFSTAQIERMLQLIRQAFKNMQDDPQLKSHLTDKNRQRISEFSISFTHQGKERFKRLDCCSIGSDGSIWILDYKISLPSQTNTKDAKIEVPAKYIQQLEQYADLITEPSLQQSLQGSLQNSQQGNQSGTLSPNLEPIHLALYFPIQKYWHTWEYSKKHHSTAKHKQPSEKTDSLFDFSSVD